MTRRDLLRRTPLALVRLVCPRLRLRYHPDPVHRTSPARGVTFIEAVRLHVAAKDVDPETQGNPLLPVLTPFGSNRPDSL